jgi:KipI family sensor histidine kinase inhibitor
MHIEPVSCDSVMLRYEARIDEVVLDTVQQDFALLFGREGFIEVVPSYASIWVRFDTACYTLENVQKYIHILLQKAPEEAVSKESRLFEVTVDYTQGVDLARIATYTGLSVEEVITRHRAPVYRVYAIGFMVGFAYLGVVDRQIAVPRLETPRAKVPKGAVAIANEQTAIYPQESAGGWNIVGVTAFDDFEKFQIGDRIRFVSMNTVGCCSPTAPK